MDERQRTLIFDVDGTLVDSAYHHAMAWGRAFQSVGLDVPIWRVHRAIGMGGDQLVAHVCDDDVEQRLGNTLRDRWDAAYQELVHEVTALPGAREVMESLHQKGFRICVASSGKGRDTDTALDVAGVREFLHAVTTGDDVEGTKPAPDVIEHAWQHAGGGPAVVIGDSVYDVQAASRIGLNCVAVRTGGFGTAELTDAGAALVVDGLEDLLGLDWARLCDVPPSTAKGSS